MKVVSQNSDSDIAKNRAREGLRWPARRLTANLLRIVRGAGSPHEIMRQINALNEAILEYEAAFGHGASGYDFQQALALDERIHRGDLEGAEDTIVSGALRLVAGRLAGQDLQARHGENEMMEGVYRCEKIREENRRRYQAEVGGKPRRVKRSPKPSPVDL